MEQINIGITKEKKEDLRVQIQILQSEINELKQNGDKYGRLPEKQRYLEYLKQEWEKLNTTLGKEFNSVVRESTEQRLSEKKQELDFKDVTINEQWAIDNHYRQMAELQRNIISITNQIKRELDPIKKANLQGKLSYLEKDFATLKSYTKSDIIMFAKARKAAYLNAKKRQQSLSAMEKLKIKINGKDIVWDNIKDDPSYTAATFDMMYQQRSR